MSMVNWWVEGPCKGIFKYNFKNNILGKETALKENTAFVYNIPY